MRPAQAREILIVSADPSLRRRLRAILTEQGLGPVIDVGEPFDELRVGPGGPPRAAFVDLDGASPFGLEDLRELARRLPGCDLVAIGAGKEPPNVAELIAAGAVGYVGRSSSDTALRRAIRVLGDGEPPMPRRMGTEAVRLLVAMRAREPASASDRAALERLTPRQRQILRLLADGLTDREIATELGISTRTVESHIGNILAKLHVRNRVAAARLAAEL